MSNSRKADVVIIVSTSERGISYIGKVTALLEQHLDITHAEMQPDTGSSAMTVYGTTMLSLAELSAVLYSDQQVARLLRKLHYTRPKENLTSMLGAQRALPIHTPDGEDDGE